METTSNILTIKEVALGPPRYFSYECRSFGYRGAHPANGRRSVFALGVAVLAALSTRSEHSKEVWAMWHFLFLAFQWHRGKRSFVILSLAFLAFLLYAVAHVH